MHFLQSDIWKNIKRELGNGIIEYSNNWIQVTELPLGFKIGYIPRVDISQLNFDLLYEAAKKSNLVYVRIDPSNQKNDFDESDLLKEYKNILQKAHPIHLQDNVLINLNKNEEEWLSGMKQKHRYNINLAKKKDLKFEISKEEVGLNKFLDLYEKSVLRQGYSARSKSYIRKVWEGFKKAGAEVFVATVFTENKPISSWFLVGYEKTLYYLYGGNDNAYRNLMGNYFLSFELFKYAKSKGFESLDLFGIENPDQPENKLDGFTRFKLGFGGEVIKYSDTIDIVTNKFLYKLLRVGELLRSKIVFGK